MMMGRVQLHMKHALLLLIPLGLFGQGADYPVPETSAPAEVSASLRERMTQFFTFHTGGVNRRAIDLVAEDTKDYYFEANKTVYVDAKILGMDFSSDLRKAIVRAETTQTLQVQQLSAPVTIQTSLLWKMEEGKWVWYMDKQVRAAAITPMGFSAVLENAGKRAPVPLTNPDGTQNIPKDFAEPERVAAQAELILGQAGLDSNSVTLTSGKKEEAQVKFRNGFNGFVSLGLHEKPIIPGLTVTLSKADLGPREDAVVRFTYDPAEPAPGNLLRTYTLRLSLTPFNQDYPITLTLAPAN
jgi:hypothetical protein